MQAEVLRNDLDRLVLRARPRLRAHALRRSLVPSLEMAAGMSLAAPSALLSLQLLSLMGIASIPFPPLALAAGASLALPLLCLSWRLARAYYATVIVRSTALSLYDRQMNLEDRLVTAEEFLGLGRADAFCAAAIEDAASFVDAARQARLDTIARREPAHRMRSGWYVAGAVTMLLLAAGLDTLRNTRSSSGESSAVSTVAAVSPARSLAEIEAERSPDTRSGERRTGASASMGNPGLAAQRMTPTMGAAPDANAGASSSSGSAGVPGDSEHPGAGGAAHRPPPSRNADKQTMALSSAGGSSGSGGVSSRQGQSGASGAGSSGSAGDSGASGKGSDSETSGEESSMQNGNEGGSGSDGRERAATETEMSAGNQSRAGAGPQSADARSAQSSSSSRNASGSAAAGGAQGEGQGGSPGSQSGEKKSRGVASLILGEPLPDRIQGQPTPGPTRTMQQQVAPQPESADAAQAQSREPRGTLMQPLARTPSPPWMQAVIERYFNRPRTDGPQR